MAGTMIWPARLRWRAGSETSPVRVALGTAESYEQAMDAACLVPIGHAFEEAGLWIALGLADSADDVWGVFDQARAGSPLKEVALLKLARFFLKG